MSEISILHAILAIEMNAASFLKRNIRWTKTADAELVYTADDSHGRKLAIRLNDFPAEPMYTLLWDAVAVESFDDWPQSRRIDMNLGEFPGTTR
jgi:hypothetical protein